MTGICYSLVWSKELEMNMKDIYIADARLRRKKKDETYREFGQAIEDLFRKAYPDNAGIVEDNHHIFRQLSRVNRFQTCC